MRTGASPGRSPRRSTSSGTTGARACRPRRGGVPRRPPSSRRPPARAPAGPRRTLIVVPNDDTVAPFSTSQFQPPSDSCSPKEPVDERRHVHPEIRAGRDDVAVDARLDLALEEPVIGPWRLEVGIAPGDTVPDQSRPPAGPARSRDRARTVAAAPGRGRCRSSRATTAVPPHVPSGAWSARSRAPQPSVATLDRSAAMASSGSSVRSRITCQRIEGSESSNQSMTVMVRVSRSGRVRVHVWRPSCSWSPSTADVAGGRAWLSRR